MRFLLFGLLAIVPMILADAPIEQTITELIKETSEKFDKAIGEIKKNAGLSQNPTGDEIVKVIKQRNDKLAKDIQDLRGKIEETIKTNPQANEALTSIKGKLKEAQDKLKKENPEIAKNAEKLGESLKSTWDSIAQEVEKSYKEFSKKGGKQDDIENFLKSVIDKGTEAAKDLKDNIDKAVNKKP